MTRRKSSTYAPSRFAGSISAFTPPRRSQSTTSDPAAPEPTVEALDEALEALSASDERKARIGELHYFAGLTHSEIARALDLSPATVDRDLRFARAWLKREMS